jgi:hypothetical protein
MPVEMREYCSAQEIAEGLDKEISETEKDLSDYLRRLDKIHVPAVRSKKIREVVLKLAGEKATTESLDEISIGEVKVVLDVKAFHELVALEPVVKSHQERLLALKKAREAVKSLDPLNDIKGMRYVTVENEGIPERIMLKIS